MLLDVKDVTHRFGGLVALKDVSFGVTEGEIKAVIGPNGAGKTTLFNIISGVFRPTSGRVAFRGRPITGLKPHHIATRGISRTFQNLSLFTRMTTLENVMIGRHSRTSRGMLASSLRLPWQRREERQIVESAMERLDYVGLAHTADIQVGSLAFGQRRMVELARALATDPEVLLLDEPASGLNTKETDDLAEMICRIRDRGITILIVEHDMSLVMDISDSIVVLDFGTPIAEGPPAVVRNDPKVVSVYLGGEFNDAKG